MSVDLKTLPMVGLTMKGTLIFEKAGKIEIEYKVEPSACPATAASPLRRRAALAMSTTRLASFIRVVAWGAAIGVAIAAGFLYFRYPEVVQLAGTATIGGPFKLTTHAGRQFSSEMLEGRPYALFFGFTNCPDVCPTTLMEMSNHLAVLGPDGDRLTVLFVTVDPERDTAEHLKEYLAAFDRRIIALTGSAEDIALVARAYHVFYAKVPTSSGYTMNHTATIFLIDRKGVLVSTTNDEESEAVQLEKLRRLLAPCAPVSRHSLAQCAE